jgi:5-methylcytosine-specific restriction endonuclease McrBC regulatory subunit McrC
MADYYIGYRWLDRDRRLVLHVMPKRDAKKRRIDFLGMFAECLNDIEVAKHLDETYVIDFDDDWIDIEQDDYDITHFLVLHFLKVVQAIARKGLKKGYLQTRENLTAKIKGKIEIRETLKRNILNNRPDRTYCSYQVYTTNFTENRILKTALISCTGFVAQLSQTGHRSDAQSSIVKLFRQNLSAFEHIETIDVTPSMFQAIHHSPFFSEYKKALRLAEMIFKRFGYSWRDMEISKKRQIPPFVINMPELFERYVEVILRKRFGNALVPGYGMNNGNSYSCGLRPDFLVRNEKYIIDAKYKYWYETSMNCENFKDDFAQLSLYGRDIRIKNVLKINDAMAEPWLILIYPKLDERFGDLDDFEKALEYAKKTDFSNLYKIPLEIKYFS